MFQGVSLNYHGKRYDVVFPGSEMPEWFSHQCMGNEVNIMEPFSHLCNDWIGIVVCVVFCSLPCHQIHNDPVRFWLKANGKDMTFVGREQRCWKCNIDDNMVVLSNHTWLLYLLP